MRKGYLLILCLVVLAAPIVGYGADRYVDSTNPGICLDETITHGSSSNLPWCTINFAILQLQTGDTLHIKGNFTITAPLVIPADNITLMGESDSNRSEINGNGKFQVITCNDKDNVTLKYLKITNGKAANSGGICFYSSSSPLKKLTIENCTITNNDTTDVNGYSGGVYCKGAALTITNTEIKENKINSDPNAEGSDIYMSIPVKIKLINGTWNNGVIGQYKPDSKN